MLWINCLFRMKEDEMKKLVEQRKREKIEDQKARQRVKDQIEADKAARRQKYGGDAQQPSTAQPAPTTSVPAQQAPKPQKDYSETRLQVIIYYLTIKLAGYPKSFKYNFFILRFD